MITKLDDNTLRISRKNPLDIRPKYCQALLHLKYFTDEITANPMLFRLFDRIKLIEIIQFVKDNIDE